MMKRSLVFFCGLAFAVSIALSFVNSPVVAQVYTAFSVSGEGSPVPWKTEARLAPSDTGMLWGESAGLLNSLAVVGGPRQQVQSGGVYIRYAADGFWSSWGYIPFVQGSNDWTFANSITGVRSVGTLAHYNLTRVTVVNANYGWDKIVDVRTGINGNASSIMVSGLPDSLRKVNSSGYIDYRIPNTNCYVTAEKDGWTYIAPFQGTGVPITLNMKTGVQIVKVNKGGLPLANANVYAVHEAYFNQSALSINNYIANATPMVTLTNGCAYPKSQVGMTMRYIASEQNSNDFYKATSAVTVISNGGASDAKVIIPDYDNPTLISPVNGEIIDYYDDPVTFSWEATPNAAGYKIYLEDYLTEENDTYNVGNFQSVNVSFDSGVYIWSVIPYDSEGDEIGNSEIRIFAIDEP